MYIYITTVYTPIGDGKTHYIKQQLDESDCCLIIAVNESFTPLNAILKLRSLPRNRSCKVFFNFTIVVSNDNVSGCIYTVLAIRISILGFLFSFTDYRQVKLLGMALYFIIKISHA